MYFIKMLRKNYQEKYIIPKKNSIEKISKDVQEVSFLFQELFEEIKKQDTQINTIEDNVEDIKQQIDHTENTIKDSQNESNKFYILVGSLFGGGLGSLMVLYNPYAAIGTCIGGVIGGGFLAKMLEKP
jgi:hypothetical protein